MLSGEKKKIPKGDIFNYTIFPNDKTIGMENRLVTAGV